MSRRCAAIYHVPFEKLGAFEAPIINAGYAVEYIHAPNLDVASALTADLVVVLGGPIGVGDQQAYPYLKTEIDLLKQRIADDKPTLGICLGAQLMVHAGGGRVYAGQNGKEIGWSPIQITEAGQVTDFMRPFCEDGPKAMMFHWHGDTFDLPKGAKLLASSPQYKNQIFQLGRNCLGFQCHPELVSGDIEYWLIGHANELMANSFDPCKIRDETQTYASTLEGFSRKAVQAWLSGLEI